ncbi:calcium-translocating P-type ATPase, PMCA-type [Fulvivirgaceae bacterium BMA10]|uniref:P-type Ca(2+) transporter n=1 Tax=Splendidivirga corallicola TaxID=3051826 RepID=A0ABT8KT26_9BACT|nr:calcium-translocating P-type ATPase, PMCA-type [Fulvivirgaceae bacterium BMA10]
MPDTDRLNITKTKAWKGLSIAEAKKRLTEYGRNELLRTKRTGPWKILLRQFTSPLILLLFAAALISFAIGFFPDQEPNVIDTALIMTIVIISGVIGFVQDYNAEKTIEALQKMAEPKSKVIRDGVETEINSANLVPGDILLLESGDMITGDGLVVDAFHLQVDESVLTGESSAVRKNLDELVFMNTYVTEGNAKVQVSSTGMNTKIGQVAAKLQELEKEKSTFQLELAKLSRKLSLITLLITIAIAVVGIFKYGIYTSLLTAISLAVAAIPEGLPAVVVLALAAGAKKMFRKAALIRKLGIVESVGAVDIICTDKTGTLTLNEMTVTKLYVNGQVLSVEHIGEIGSSNKTIKCLLKCGALCNNATPGYDSDGIPRFFGEQTEIALLKFGREVLGEQILRDFEKLNEVSFSSKRKMMTVVVADKLDKITVFSKGAPEVLLEKCNKIEVAGEILPLTQELKKSILDQNERFGSKALRVLGFAYKSSTSVTENIENGLIWLGLQAMIDPPRAEVKEAIHDCKTAGIRVIMITGDNPQTAMAIAEQVGMITSGVINGHEIENIPDKVLEQKLKEGVNIFARTDPFHKLRILDILEKDNSVAMTGDGVNDALALKRAGVGIAMGKKGTEVAKQASDIILLDDNFSTIRDAIKEGRTIFNNIRKFIDYLLTCNFAEVSMIFLITLFIDLPEPVLFPVQLLWINLLTDGLVALALGVDPPSKDIMHNPPRKNDEPLIDQRLAYLIGFIGFKKTLLLIATFILILPAGLEVARTALLTGIVLFEFVRIGAIRYMEKLTFFDNRWLVAGLVASVLLQMAIVYSPLNQYFKLVPLSSSEWIILIAGVFIGYFLAILITRLVLKKFPLPTAPNEKGNSK